LSRRNKIMTTSSSSSSSSPSSSTTLPSPRPLKVCIIGGGPGAMFFCHAWNRQRREAEEVAAAGTEASVTTKTMMTTTLDITCFEQQSTAGGVWRMHKDDVEAYEELWTNGCCYALEFHDYTFHKHFFGGKENNEMSSGGGGATGTTGAGGGLVDVLEERIPVYLPRQDVSNYILQRVMKDSPTFLEDYFQFNTKVLKVESIDPSSSSSSLPIFRVTTQHLPTMEITTHFFDKCIWAAGENSIGSIPPAIQSMFDNAIQHFSQQEPPTTTPQQEKDIPETPSKSRFCMLHSNETKQIRVNVTGRKVLLIGGGFSAEDLALQCLKWGAAHVDILARSDAAEVTWTSQWPGPNHVQVHTGKSIRSVNPDNGSILLSPVEMVWPRKYVWANDDDDDEDSSDDDSEEEDDDEEKVEDTVLYDVQTVIFCTGYQASISMLDDTLRPACGCIPGYYMGTDPSLNMSELSSVLKTWKMNTDNVAYPYTGDIPAGTRGMLRTNYNHPEMHRGIFFPNPNLMFLCEHGSDAPLLSLDVHAWLLCSYLTGRVPMPTIPELIQANHQQVLDQLELPHIRYYMDQGYFKVLDYDENGYWDLYGPGDQAESDYTEYHLRLLAKVMEEGKYPGLSLGTYEELNENGKAIIEFGMCSYRMRSDLIQNYTDGHEWRTFRDDIIEPEKQYSLYTGHCARPLRQKWMDISTTANTNNLTTTNVNTIVIGPTTDGNDDDLDKEPTTTKHSSSSSSSSSSMMMMVRPVSIERGDI